MQSLVLSIWLILHPSAYPLAENPLERLEVCRLLKQPDAPPPRFRTWNTIPSGETPAILACWRGEFTYLINIGPVPFSGLGSAFVWRPCVRPQEPQPGCIEREEMVPGRALDSVQAAHYASRMTC